MSSQITEIRVLEFECRQSQVSRVTHEMHRARASL